MNRISCIFVCCILILSLAACNSSVNVFDSNDKMFSGNGIEITLTESFELEEIEGYTMGFDSENVCVFVLKENFSQSEGLSELSLAEYSQMVYRANTSKFPGDVYNERGLTCMEYSFYNQDEAINYKYLSVMMKGSAAFWLIQFCCDADSYDVYYDEFIERAQTIVVE